MSDIASGLFALGGAVIGGLASLLGTVTDAKHRHEDAVQDRVVKLTENRRLLYSSFVERSDVVIDAARDVLSYDDPADAPDESEDRYLEAWGQFVQVRASVEIVGPDSAADAATGLYRSVADVCNEVDSWYFGHQPWTADKERKYVEQLQLRTAARRQFVTVAQRIIAAGDGGG